MPCQISAFISQNNNIKTIHTDSDGLIHNLGMVIQESNQHVLYMYYSLEQC